jgi:Flp pilus assembly protein TadG
VGKEMHHRLRKIRNVRRWQRFTRLIRFRHDERGVQLVEVAIVIPILLMLFGAVGEFGRYFYEYTTVAKAARVGARYMASKSLDSQTINWQDKAKKLVVYGNTDGTGSPVLSGLTIDNVQLSYAGGSYSGGNGVPDTVTVTIIDYKHQPIFDLGKLTKSSLSLAVDVKPSVTMHYMLNSGSV